MKSVQSSLLTATSVSAARSVSVPFEHHFTNFFLKKLTFLNVFFSITGLPLGRWKEITFPQLSCKPPPRRVRGTLGISGSSVHTTDQSLTVTGPRQFTLEVPGHILPLCS